MQNDRIEALLVEVGPLIDAVSLVVDDGGSTWTFEFEDEPACTLAVGAREGHYVLDGDVADLPEDGRAELLEIMLIYNDQSAETGGARLAIDAPDGMATLAIDLNSSELDISILSILIGDFRALRAHWRTVIEGWTGGEPPDRVSIPSGPLMRV